MSSTTDNLFIQNGMIVDGTGAAAFKANLRIRDGIISEISDTISAASDERVFDDPFRVNLARTQNKHLSFGQQGPHVCLGMWLARLEVRVLFQELSKRITSIEASGPHQFLRSNFVGGIKSLPVRITTK